MRLLAAGFLKHLHPRLDDDFVDRLNYYYTPILLTIAATVVSTKQFVSKPIQCWIPPQFSASMEEYIEQYCWMQNTYWLPMHENIPDDHHVRDSLQIGYYQWTFFILITQAFLFTLPCIIWRLTSWRSGLSLHYLVTSACDIHVTETRDKSSALDEISTNLQSVLEIQAGVSRTVQIGKFEENANIKFLFSSTLRRIGCCSYGGCYVTGVYLCTKFFYSLNVIAQFFLLNAFLKTEDAHVYGFRVLGDLIYGRQWSQSGHFPRITLCDFQVRSLGNINRYTVQCALNANLFNEKIFLFVWIWIIVLAGVTLASFVFWIFNLAFSTQRASFVLTYLRIAATQSEINSGSSISRSTSIFSASSLVYDNFIESYLAIDGVLALRMIANHAGDVVTMEIVKRLWRMYRNRKRDEESGNDGQCETGMVFGKGFRLGLTSDGAISVLTNETCCSDSMGKIT